MSTHPDLGARLREARRSRGLSQALAAEGIGISRPTLIAVEQGRREPTPAELVSMARIYGRQVHDLVRDTPPVEALSARFRLEPGVRDETSDAVSTMQRVADNVIELEGLMGAETTRAWPAPYDTSDLPLEVAGQQVASAERQRLGLGNGPLPKLREVLEDDYEIRVFALQLPRRVAGLFAVAEPIGACVGFNARHPHERQRWTLAHELGHFLMHRSAPEITPIDVGRSREERLAEIFAANFLVPEEGLIRRFQSIRRSRGGTFSPVELLQLAAHYEVSAQAMAIRLEDERLVSSGWWDSLVARGLRVHEAQEHVGVERVRSDTELLPVRSQYLAVEAFLDGRLSEGRLARTFDSDRVAAREKVRQLSGSNDVAPQGELRSFALSFDDLGTA